MALRRGETLPDLLLHRTSGWPATFPTNEILLKSRPRGSDAGILSPKTKGFKVVLIGDASVGKTSLLLRLTRGRFFEAVEPTVGTAFTTYEVTVDESVVKLEIWDTAGQERFSHLMRLYYTGAKAIILIYDITNKKCGRTLTYWIDELDYYFSEKADKPIIYLVGNKRDLESQRVVTYSDVESFVKNEKLLS